MLFKTTQVCFFFDVAFLHLFIYISKHSRVNFTRKVSTTTDAFVTASDINKQPPPSLFTQCDLANAFTLDNRKHWRTTTKLIFLLSTHNEKIKPTIEIDETRINGFSISGCIFSRPN